MPDLFGRPDLATSRDLTAPAADQSLDGAADLAGARNSGDCQDSHDCPGGVCVELSPGGYRVCTTPVPPTTTCSPRPELDQCCKTTDCSGPGQLCLESPLSPYCGGPPPLVYNVCASDACQNNADCPGLAVCVPPGVFGNKVRACLAASCRRDTDCTAEPSGRCLPLKDPCCGATRGLYCVYPSGCRTSADCPGGYCEAVGAHTQCHSGPPPCPP